MLRIITFISLFSCSLATLRADARFDTLFNQSEVIIYGQVVRHEISPVQDDLGTIHCWMDFWVTQICTGGKTKADSTMQLQAGDTIKQLFYYGGYINLGDTLSYKMGYVIPLITDSTSLSGWKLTNADATYGTFTDLSIMTNHCPVKFVLGYKQILSEEQTQHGKWAGHNLYYPNGQLKEVYSQSGYPKKFVEKKTEYSESGKKMRRTRTKTVPVGWSSKTIVWTFRENGNCKFRRYVWRTRI